jgi:hypothetical protein
MRSGGISGSTGWFTAQQINERAWAG